MGIIVLSSGRGSEEEPLVPELGVYFYPEHYVPENRTVLNLFPQGDVSFRCAMFPA